MSEPNSSTTEPVADRTKSVLITVFITLFLDLVGFSIIFPLFPAMLDYYVKHEGDTGFLGQFISFLERFNAAVGGASDTGVIVLFGGVLASLYSLLQFFFSPIIGSLSDRYGRKPLLLLSIAGLALSYVLWVFAGAFVVLVIARTIGGMMSGNISTASAVVADVTTVRNRPRGMAIIGMAFGLGFILGPAIGGISATVDLTAHFPGLVEYGLNPFSMPALIALALALVNLFFVAFHFHETLPPNPDTADRVQRTINPLALFQTADYPGVAKTSIVNFLFLTAFSGAEFGLTFLAAERLGYGPEKNAMLFVFVGVVLALVQGGYVRRKGPVIGPKRMALQGFVAIVPGIALLAFAPNAALIYLALFFMAVGSAQIIPCLTSLASGYAPANVQGRVLGVFRSLGALARGVGPLVACVLYWRLGASTAYLILAAAVLLPLAITMSLPRVNTPELAER